MFNVQLSPSLVLELNCTSFLVENISENLVSHLFYQNRVQLIGQHISKILDYGMDYISCVVKLGSDVVQSSSCVILKRSDGTKCQTICTPVLTSLDPHHNLLFTFTTLTNTIEKTYPLQSNPSLYNLALELVNTGVWEWNTESNSFYLSEFIHNMCGTSPTDTIDADDIANLYLPGYREIVKEKFDDIVTHGGTYENLGPLKNQRTGEIHWAKARGQTLVAEDGTMKLFGALRDVTEEVTTTQKNQEIIMEQANTMKQLENTKNQLNSALKDLKETQRITNFGFFKFDCRTRQFWFDSIAREIHGLCGDDNSPVDYAVMRSRLAAEYLLEWDRVFDHNCRCRSLCTETFTVEEHRYTFHEPPKLIYVTKRGRGTKFDEHGDVLELSGIVQDTTELSEARMAAQSANKAKSMFLATVSHELRTPLNSILGLLSMLQSSSSLTPIQAHVVNVVTQSGNTLLSLVSNILDFSKIEQGKIDLDITELRIPDIIDAVLLMFSDQSLMRSDVDFGAFIDPRLDVIVAGDRFRIQQIVVNLVANAIKFTDVGHVFIHVSLLSSNTHNVSFTISVEDTGIGIPKPQQNLLFKAFSQVGTSLLAKQKGSGLGLAISDALAGLMNSKIEFRSTYQKGSRFWLHLTLPLGETKATPTRFETTECFVAMEDGFSKRLMLRQLRALKLKVIDLYRHSLVSNFAENALKLLSKFSEPTKHFQTLLISESLCQKYPQILEEYEKTVSVWHLASRDQLALLGSKTLFLPFTFKDLVTLFSEPEGRSGEHLLTTASGPHDLAAVGSIREAKSKEQWYILIADDHPINQKVISMLLNSLNCSYKAVNDGTVAIEEYIKDPYAFDLILMDYRMHFPGTDAAREIRSFEDLNTIPRVPIIMLTADASVESKLESLKAAMNGWVTKPVTRETLALILNKFLPEEKRKNQHGQ
ncbi:hypothetical protein P9112_008895 [Eukaryota sp. TZLM1-RC]